MTELSRIGIVDLVVVAVVIGAAVSALRHGGGVLAALGGTLGALVLSWLVVVGLLVWGPAAVRAPMADSALVDTFPVPDRALADLGHRPHLRP